MKLKLLTAALLLSSTALYAHTAQTVDVSRAWVRATVPGQQATGAYMHITSKNGARLVGVSSPAAGIMEVHQMKMEGDVMKMRAAPVLDLPAGQTVQLKPGGYHVMMMDLKQALEKGSSVPMTLHLQDAKGLESTLVLSVPVRTLAPSGGAASPADSRAVHGAHTH
ncbi:MAG: hypothetical protein JWR74_2197 [Polaromonas sp.]|nr:hypothetical protein [Polaromonas sp.]